MGLAHRRGEWGENVARVFLELCGYRYLDSRYRRPGGEIDLVMRQGSLVVFVEVKTRTDTGLGLPEECIYPRQKQRIRRLAGRWLAEHRGQAPGDVRFDLVAISVGAAGSEHSEVGASIRHLPGVY